MVSSTDVNEVDPIIDDESVRAALRAVPPVFRSLVSHLFEALEVTTSVTGPIVPVAPVVHRRPGAHLHLVPRTRRRRD